MRSLETTDEIVRALQDLNVRVYRRSLYGACRGQVRKYKGDKIILIEETLSFDAMLKTLKHELYHILNDDLDRDESNEQIEHDNPY